MAHYEPSHLDVHCLHKSLFWVLIDVLGFNDTSTLVGHFVSISQRRGRKEIEEIVEEMKERDREEKGNERI